MLTLLRQKVLTEFGDQGADLMDRFFTQIEYTASLCIGTLTQRRVLTASFLREGMTLSLSGSAYMNSTKLKPRMKVRVRGRQQTCCRFCAASITGGK